MDHRRSLRAAFVALVAMALAGLVATAAFARPAPARTGQLWVYLAPMPPGSERLSFRIAEIAAESEGGELVPLELEFARVEAREPSRERLLAFGILPAGTYTGLRIAVDSARLGEGPGAAEMRLPEAPTRIDVPFELPRRGAHVLSISLSFKEAVAEEYRFVPAFAAEIPRESALGAFGLTVSRGAGTVTYFDKLTGRVFAVVPVGEAPASIALSREGTRAYVTLAGEDALAVLGVEERLVLERVPLSAADAPEQVALTPDGRTLITANAGSGTVSLIDAEARVEIERIRVGDGPLFLAVDPLGRRAYVCNTRSDTISVIDLARRKVAVTLSTEPVPLRVAFDRAGERLYLIHRSSPHLLVIDAGSLAIAERVYVGAGATALTVDPRSGRILLARRGAIEVYDPLSLLPVDSIPVEGEVAHLSVDVESNNLHLVLPRQNRIRVLRLSNWKLLTELDLGAGPAWVTLMGER